MDFIQIAISARLAHGDLVGADKALEAGPEDHAIRLVLLKQLLVSCANVADLEGISRGLYKDHPELNEIISTHRRGFEFAKYMRNIAVGHVNPALCRKAIEWRPELNAVLATHDAGADAFLSYAVLETAINTFVDGERHKVFESDTDLAYPPDLTRFLNYVGEWALASAGLDRSRSHRPRAQAAAWALCDRATNGQSDMLTPDVARLAERDVAVVAGPLLIAIGVHPGATRDELLRRLRASGQHGHEGLVRTAAVAADAATGISLNGGEQTLCRLARGETLDSLSPTDRAAVEAWSRGLNLGGGFERFIAWIAELVFKLPLNGDIGDSRGFELPERIGVLTMRSMTPHREEDGGGVDEGA